MTPEELLIVTLKQDKKIVLGQTIGTDANGNCTIQGVGGSVLAISGGQISAGSAIALKADDGQWYAVSARQTGTVSKKSLFKRKSRPETKTETTANIKILFKVGSDIFIGGDRDIPEQIYTIPSGFEIEKANISASGIATDDWVVQIVLRSTAVMNAYRLSQDGTTEQRGVNSFFFFYLNNRSVFVDSLRLITVSPNATKEIKDTGVKTSRDTNTSVFLFVYENILQGQGPMDGSSFGVLNFYVRETYEVNASDWSFRSVKKTCDIIGYRGVITQTPLTADTKVIAEAIRSTILAGSSPLHSWKTPSDAGLSDTYEGFSFTLSGSEANVGEWLLLNVEIAGFGWWYSFDTTSLSFLLESTASRSAEPYTWSNKFSSSRDEVSLFSGLPNLDDLLRSGNLFNGLHWLGFFCGFDGKVDNASLPLTTRKLFRYSQADINSLPLEQRYMEVDINVSPSRSFSYSAILGFIGGPYSYPVSRLSYAAFIGFSQYAVSSYQAKESYILQGAGEETQLIKNNANNMGTSQLFDLYVGGETKIVACPFRPKLLNGNAIFGSFNIDLDGLTFDVQGYKLDGVVIPPEIVSNGITPKNQPIKPLNDNAAVLSSSIFLDIDSYNELPNT